ncbi:MAG: GNAT family N-acetyltransferase, partial [Gemmatimonadota bacterium]
MRWVHLPDGTPVLIRPIVPEDKTLLLQYLLRLSPQSAYRRFMAPLKSLSERQLEYLTDIDYNDHMAWTAVDPLEPGHPLLGVARYIRFTGDPRRAEVAAMVLDSHQGRGLGTLLFSMLWQSAVANGIDVFVAYV